jgi:hypothetical protein
VATIGSGGLATAVATGTSKISATLKGISGTTLLTVTAPAAATTASQLAQGASSSSLLSEADSAGIAPLLPAAVKPRKNSGSAFFMS